MTWVFKKIWKFTVRGTPGVPPLQINIKSPTRSASPSQRLLGGTAELAVQVKTAWDSAGHPIENKAIKITALTIREPTLFLFVFVI
ncbi:MAG: hypothetical protein HY892_16290 [Deltaproteobacteria bacterium]|nr:hypothetical protein [Deltaproteobacteria bacterium]